MTENVEFARKQKQRKEITTYKINQHHDLETELFIFLETPSTNKLHFMFIVCATRRSVVQTNNGKKCFGEL